MRTGDESRNANSIQAERRPGPGPGSRAVASLVMLLAAGCMMVGPDYVQPTAPVAESWTEKGNPNVKSEGEVASRWWTVFRDPALDALVETAYEQNLDLRTAGLRVLEAEAQRAATIGSLFPQTQEAAGSYTRFNLSQNTAQTTPSLYFDRWQAGFDASWELDFWGKFRRGIEASDAGLLASLAGYEAALVTLVGEVARTYVQIRVLEERIAVASRNVEVQKESLGIARVRFEAGGTSEYDVQQALTLLLTTEATIPQLQIQLRQAQDTLNVLLGRPPRDPADIVGGSGKIPVPPIEVAVGIPADLLRRRPDVRQAERQLAAQSAQIGVTKAQLFPQFQIAGSFGLESKDLGLLFDGDSFSGSVGPQFNWPILNYGRIVNSVRVQDAQFQELAAVYEKTILQAQQDVEDALVGYLRGREQVGLLEGAVAAADRAVEISLIQYREGGADYTVVLDSQQFKLQADDQLATARGSVTQSVVSLYRALGGGWEIGEGKDVVPEKTKQEMRSRTYWGGMLETEREERDVEEASSGTEKDRGWWRWRAWWPIW